MNLRDVPALAGDSQADKSYDLDDGGLTATRDLRDLKKKEKRPKEKEARNLREMMDERGYVRKRRIMI